MFKTFLILSAMFLAACAPENKSQPSDQVNCCGPDAGGQGIFQKGGPVTAPTSLLGVWELPADVQPTSTASVRVVITQNTMTIAGKCEFIRDGQVVETLYAVATKPSSLNEDALTTEKTVEQNKTSGERQCRVFIKAASNKYVINRESKSFCIMVSDRCVANFTKIAD